MTDKTVFKVGVGAAGAAFGMAIDLYRQLPPPSAFLVECMFADMVTGVLAALIAKTEYRSFIGIRGFAKKALIGALIMWLYRTEEYVPAARAAGLFSMFVWGFIGLEVTSICENLARAGMMPPKIREAIAAVMPAAAGVVQSSNGEKQAAGQSVSSS